MAIGNGKVEVELGEGGRQKQREQRYCATARKHVDTQGLPNTG